jgi:predicted nuclease of predicted toxin-antitoxin system
VKLLFDQNISARIVRLLSQAFPECTQVTLVKLNNARDMEIWDWAKLNGFCIVTFDSDFLDIATMHGFPPKILLLRTGNRKTIHLAELLQNKKQFIEDFFQDANIGCLEIF